MEKIKKIVVLAGGFSEEKEISLNAHKDTLKEVSEGLNHGREDITNQYLSRA